MTTVDEDKYCMCMIKGCAKLSRKGYKFCGEHMVEVKDKLFESGNETEDSIVAALFW